MNINGSILGYEKWRKLEESRSHLEYLVEEFEKGVESEALDSLISKLLAVHEANKKVLNTRKNGAYCHLNGSTEAEKQGNFGRRKNGRY